MPNRRLTSTAAAEHVLEEELAGKADDACPATDTAEPLAVASLASRARTSRSSVDVSPAETARRWRTSRPRFLRWALVNALTAVAFVSGLPLV
jgi:hypothetical protein